MGTYTHLVSGYLKDAWDHAMDRKKDYWGYVEYDGQGNGDRVAFDGSERSPFMRNRKVIYDEI